MEMSRVLASCALAFGVIHAAALGFEAIYVGALVSPEALASYHFGSESMVGVGGLAYGSVENYVSLSAAGAGMFLWAAAAWLAFLRKGGLVNAGAATGFFCGGLFIVYGV